MDEHRAPDPLLVLHVEGGRVLYTCPRAQVPEWAKPIVQAAVRRFGAS